MAKEKIISPWEDKPHLHFTVPMSSEILSVYVLLLEFRLIVSCPHS